MSITDRLESAIMDIASKTHASVTLKFLLEIQLHIDELRETHLAQCGEINEIINDMDRGALVQGEEIRKRLSDLTGYGEVPEE